MIYCQIIFLLRGGSQDHLQGYLAGSALLCGKGKILLIFACRQVFLQVCLQGHIGSCQDFCILINICIGKIKIPALRKLSHMKCFCACILKRKIPVNLLSLCINSQIDLRILRSQSVFLFRLFCLNDRQVQITGCSSCVIICLYCKVKVAVLLGDSAEQACLEQSQSRGKLAAGSQAPLHIRICLQLYLIFFSHLSVIQHGSQDSGNTLCAIPKGLPCGKDIRTPGCVRCGDRHCSCQNQGSQFSIIFHTNFPAF